MKKITRLFLLIAAVVAWGSVANAANTECAGTLTTAAQGSFTLGYNYTFATSGTSVTITFELLDTQVGLVPQLVTPGNVYTNMTLVSGQKYTCTLTGQTPGATITYACYFAYSGGASRTTDLSYIVGDVCGGVADTQAPTGFTATLGTVGANTANIILNGTDDSGSVTYSIVYGTTTVSTSSASGVQKTYTVTGLTPSTGYSFAVTAKDATGNIASNSPITLTTTTTALPAPTVAAPTPPVYAAPKVISIFSDAYTNVTGTDFNPGWGQSGSDVIVQVAGNNTLKMANLNYQGIALGSHVFPLTMKYLHVDVWTANETSLQLYPICQKNGVEEVPEKYKQLSTPVLNQWNSYDIPITDFTSQGLSMADVYQFKFVGAGGNTVYLDNLYFYDNTATVDSNPPTGFTATTGAIASDAVELLLNATDDSGAINYSISYGSGPTVVTTAGLSGVQKSFTVSGLNGSTLYNFAVTAKDPTGNVSANSPITVSATTLAAYPAAPTPTYSASKVISIYSDNYTSVMGPNGWENWYGNNFSTVSLGGNSTLKDVTTCCFGVSFPTTTIDVSSMNFLHVDIYPVTPTTMTFGFIVANTTVTAQKALTLTTGQWNSINLSFADLKASSPTADFTQVKQISFSPVSGTFYLDNLLFYNDGTTAISSVISENGISCYPNPIANKLTVSAKTEISQMTVRNLLGQSVKTATVNGFEKVIDLSDLASGNYLLTLKLANGQFSTQKIVKL